MLQMMRFLPNTERRVLQATVVVLSLLFAFLAVRIVLRSGWELIPICVGGSLLLLATFLWRLHVVARSVTKFVIGLSIVIGLGGTFNPFFASDYRAANHGEDPQWLQMLAIEIPFVLAGMFAFWVLDKYKDEFGGKRALKLPQ